MADTIEGGGPPSESESGITPPESEKKDEGASGGIPLPPTKFPPRIPRPTSASAVAPELEPDPRDARITELKQGIIDARAERDAAQGETSEYVGERNQAIAERDAANDRASRLKAMATVVGIMAIVLAVVALFVAYVAGDRENQLAAVANELKKSKQDFKLVQDTMYMAGWRDENLSAQGIADEFVKYEEKSRELYAAVKAFGDGPSIEDVAERVEALKQERNDLKKANEEFVASATRAQEEAASQAAAAQAQPAQATTPAPAAEPSASGEPKPAATPPTAVASNGSPCIQGMIALGFTEPAAKQGCGE